MTDYEPLSDESILRLAVRALTVEPLAPLSPELAPLLAGVFHQWARMGSWDPDLMHRVGGPETVALARAVLALQPQREGEEVI